jgi:large subunit ribosomal protein L29
MKASELREMSDEQLQLTLKEACERLFRLRIQAQTERLDAPSELRHHRQLIARIRTIQRERCGPEAKSGAGAAGAANS